MSFNSISEGKILKYLALFFTVLMLVTAAIVLTIKSPGSIKEQLYDRAVEPLLVIPPNQPDVLRIVYTGVSTPVTPHICLLYTSPSPRDGLLSRMPSSA